MKNLLAIDTSTEKASLALKVGDTFFCAEQDSQKTHAQTLLPQIKTLLKEGGVALNDLDALIFGQGPGSFTGLRIACSIVKGLAYAHDIKVIPVSTLATIACSVREINKELAILAVLDARMQQMYWSYFNKNSFVAEEQVSAVQDICLPDNTPLLLAGVGLDHYLKDFPEVILSNIQDKIKVYPSAEAMIRLALHRSISHQSAAEAKPVYVRNQVTQGG